jgi:hypothetical protein
VKLSLAVGCAAAAASLVACGGGHALTPGKADAVAACRGSGTPAALAASRAAAKNPEFSTLAADVNALVAGEASQTADISDGSTDDADAGTVAAGVDLGSAGRQKVIADCMALGLLVTR